MKDHPLQITAIHIYPVKSLAGISLPSAVVERRGLQYDRRWMLINEQHRFLSQRDYPAMALIGTAIEPPFLVLFDRNNPTDRITVPLEIQPAQNIEKQVDVWDDQCPAVPVSTDADQWLSKKLGGNVQLVGMPENSIRPADEKYAPAGQYVSFADGYPFLVIGEATLAELNSRLGFGSAGSENTDAQNVPSLSQKAPVPMERFRPNIVFSGGTPHCEDEFGAFYIGNQPFLAVKPCARCIMTTIDQQTAQLGAEPLKTLATYRQSGHKILFGQNLVWTGQDAGQTISVGDFIRILGD